MKAIGYNSWRSWRATIACAVIAFLIMIPMRFSGLLFVIIIDRYGTDRKTATVPIVVFGILRTLTGPFVGYLGEAFGLRCITLIGCFLSAVGIGSLYFAEDITAVIVSLGLLYGLGIACGNTLMQTIIIQHFNKNINLANGIYFTGSCLGAVLMSPVIQYLMNKYGTSGMFLMLSGTLLHSIPAAILLEDPKNELLQSEDTRKGGSKGNIRDEQESSHLPNFISELDDQKIKETHIDEKSCHTNKNLHQIEHEVSPTDINKSNTAFINETFDAKSENLMSKSSHSNERNEAYLEKYQNYVSKLREVELLSYTKYQHFAIDDMKCTSSSNKTAVEFKIPNVNTSAVVTDHLPSKKKNISVKSQSSKLFADPTFHIIMFLNSFLAFLSTMNWTIIVDYGTDKGINIDESIYFVMFLPVAEIFGNLCFNWIVDRGFVSRTNFCTICFFVMGVDAMYMIWSSNFILMMVGVLIYGILTGVLTTTLPGLIVEFIEASQQNMALASRFILYAFLCLAKIPLVGYFREVMGSYNGIYWIIFSCSIFCGIFIQLIPVVVSCRTKRKLTEKS